MPFALRTQRNVSDAGFRYHATDQLEVDVHALVQRRDGYQPWGAGFGMTTAIELAAPIDDCTTDIGTSVEWSDHGRIVRAGYDGSWYTNNVETLVWDSPVRATDLATASAQGRMPRWPSTTTHTVSAMGSTGLPGAAA